MSTKTIRMTDGADTILPESAVGSHPSIANYTSVGKGHIKFADGTLICYGVSNIPSGSSQKQEYFDVAFVGNPVVVPKTYYTGGVGFYGSPDGITHLANTYFTMNVNASGHQGVYFSYIAIGRWK